VLHHRYVVGLVAQDQTRPVEVNDIVADGVPVAVVDVNRGAVAGQDVVADERAGERLRRDGDAGRVQARIVPVGRVVAIPCDRQASDRNVIGRDAYGRAVAADGATDGHDVCARAEQFQTIVRDVHVLVVCACGDVDRAGRSDGINARLNRVEGIIADGDGWACAVRVRADGAGKVVVNIDGRGRRVVVLNRARAVCIANR